MNPILANLPFNNENKKKARNILSFYDMRFDDCNINLDCNMQKWKTSIEKLESNTNLVINKKDKKILDKLSDVPTIVYDNLMLGLQKMFRYKNEIYKYNLCLPIYYYIKSEINDNDEIRILHNKINSILDCIDIIED